MKIITFEGHGLSGKSTQQKLLCDRLAVKACCFYDDFYVYAKNYYRQKKDKAVNLFLTLSQIRSKIHEWQSAGCIHVVDHFYEMLIDFEHEKDTGVIQFLSDALRFETDITPIASFYLYVPGSELICRNLWRDFHIEDGRIGHYPKSKIAEDELRKQFYRSMSVELDHFHFIQAWERTPIDIHNEIYSIVEGML